MSDLQLAPADSLAGKIQRGLGSGFLEAMGRARSEVEPIVLDCIANDPRISAQDEDRGLYYVRLMLALDLDERPIAEALRRDPDPDQSVTRDWLPVAVLGLLARAGRTDAVATLRDYVGWGAWWGEAVRLLADTGDPSATDGLDAVLAARPGTEARIKLLDEGGGSDEEPWRSWRQRGSLASLLAPEAPPLQPERDLASLGTRDLLLAVRSGGRRPDPATDLLVGRIQGGAAEDRALVEAALAGADIELAARAVRVLGTLGDPSIVRPGERLIADIGPFGSPKGSLRPIILRGFEGLDPSDALEVARRWRDADDYREVVATNLLELHATADDLSWTVARIRTAAAEGDDLYAYARILRRFPGSGPFDGFEAIYRHYVPTCCRAHLVDALSVADPTFSSVLAFECLFDCQPLARGAAARTVDPDDPRARDRLRQLAEDPLEEDDVRAAAAIRVV